VIVYLVTNSANGKRYVGISKDNHPGRRWAVHVQHARTSKSGVRLHEAIRTYGEAAFVVEHIASARTWSDLEATEIAIIAQYGTYRSKTGYNMTCGGDGTLGNIRSEDSRAKISERQMGRVHSAETRARIAAKASGRKASPEAIEANRRGQVGRKMNPEAIAKTAASHRGMKRSPETCAAIGASHLGRVHSDEHRAKVSVAKRGKPLSAEHRAAKAAAQIGRAVSQATRAKIAATLLAKRAQLSAAKTAWWAARRIPPS
jgi:group I intron endonuclease